MTRPAPAGVCQRPVCRKPVYGERRYCSVICETAGPGLRSGSEGSTSKPSYGGSGDLSVLAGVTGAGPDEAVYIRHTDPKPMQQGLDEAKLAADQCRECGGQVSQARVRLLTGRGSPVTCSSPCAKRIWRRAWRWKAAERKRQARAAR